MTGTPAQIEWAEQIRLSVVAEFERVGRLFLRSAERQTGQTKADTLQIIALLEEHRDTVLRNQEAGYYIRVWQEISDQVRQLLAKDARYQLLKLARAARKRSGA